MMKSLLLLCVVATCLCVSSASLIDALNAVHKSPAFHNLSHSDQLLIIELVAETEAGEVKSYIDTVGFHHVLAVIDKLPAAEAHILTQYLTNELVREENQVTTMTPVNIVGKRSSASLVQVLKTAKESAAFQNLTATDQELVIKILTAAENNTLTALTDQLGYSTILRIVDMLPVAEKHMLEQYLIQHLQAEMHAVG